LGHRTRSGRTWVLILAFLSSVQAAASPDYERERRWAEEITPTLLEGDPVYLEGENGRKFLAIHTKAREAKAGVLIVHGMGVHPDWGLIHALRSGLAEQGFATLSIQMPVLAADAQAKEYVKTFPIAATRLNGGTEFLRAQGHSNVALVAHSMGARMADHFLAHASATPVKAWVAIGMSGPLSSPARVPLLDIFGEHDLPQVRVSAAERAQARPKCSSQIEVRGADHFFAGLEPVLLREVSKFLSSSMGDGCPT
jgi:hypothetical protein